ncbi:MAG: VWA domain-containing protein, partial [Oscillospiraceae bacterium]
MKKIKKLLSNNQGFTLIELVIGIVLTAIVILISTRMFLSAEFVGTNATFNIKEQGRFVTETLDNSIKYANAVFTVPKNSFVDSKLTKAWNYIGVKENVQIPPAMVDGKTGVVAKALVHIKSVGDTEPTELNKNQVKLRNGTNGWFIETILGFEFVDPKTGYQVEYNFVLTPASGSKDGIADSSIKYKLNVAYYDVSSGTKTKVGDDLLDVETEMGGLNSLQIVYQGSTINPATAIAFHDEDYNVSITTQNMTEANIVFVLDNSGSMFYCFKGNSLCKYADDYEEDGICDGCGETTRGASLKVNGEKFIKAFTDKNCDKVRIGEVGFAGKATEMLNINSNEAKATTANFGTINDKIQKASFGGGTNIGDGLRKAYFQFEELYANYTTEEEKKIPTFVVLITDGEADILTYENEHEFYLDKYKATEYGAAEVFLENSILYNFNDYSSTKKYQETYDKFYFKKNDPGMDEKGYQIQYSYGTNQYERGQDYAVYAAKHFNSPTIKFPKPTVYLVNLVSSEGDFEKQSKVIMEGFGIKDIDKYVFDATSNETFEEALTKIITDIKVSSSFLDGPM